DNLIEDIPVTAVVVRTQFRLRTRVGQHFLPSAGEQVEQEGVVASSANLLDIADRFQVLFHALILRRIVEVATDKEIYFWILLIESIEAIANVPRVQVTAFAFLVLAGGDARSPVRG